VAEIAICCCTTRCRAGYTSRKHIDVRYNGPVIAPRSSLQVAAVADQPDAALVVSVSGELDLGTVEVLRAEVGPLLAPGVRLVLDLSELTFCDSTGLGALVGLSRKAADHSATLVLAAPRRRIADLLALSGVDRVIDVHNTVPAALGKRR
jgi:anti-sigma B factor antagonist